MERRSTIVSEVDTVVADKQCPAHHQTAQHHGQNHSHNYMKYVGRDGPDIRFVVGYLTFKK